MNLKFRNTLWFSSLVLLCYLGAIVLANALITRYGQIALPFVAFALIPFDLIARDLMQDHWNYVPNRGRLYIVKRMVVVILLGAFISWVTGTGSLRVNIASCLAFIVAGSIDALTYQWMIRYGRVFRINAATLTGAITDSIIFVTIAFSSVNWKLVGLQIGMKVSGGFCWSLLLYRFFRKPFDLRESVEPPFDPEHSISFNVKCWMCFDEGSAICQCHDPHPVGQPALPCNLICS